MRIVRHTTMVVLAAVAVGQARADEVTLTDRNSTASFNTSTQAGWFNWTVDGTDQLAQSWFWFRTDDGAESSIDTLTQTGIRVLDLDADPGTERLLVQYESPDQFRMTLTYDLLGGTNGSGASSLPLGISVDNIGDGPLDLQLFHYTDFDLGGSAQDDFIEITNGNRAVQRGGLASSEFLAIPRPSGFEAGLFSSTRDSLNDGGPTTLNGEAGPLGPGNLTSTFSFDIQLQPNDSFVGSEVIGITVVPEPGTLVLLVAGIGVMARRRRRH